MKYIARWLWMVFNQSQLIPMYYHPLNPQLSQTISFKGIIKDIEPACIHMLPLDFYNCLNIISNVDDVFAEMDGYELYKMLILNLNISLHSMSVLLV